MDESNRVEPIDDNSKIDNKNENDMSEDPISEVHGDDKGEDDNNDTAIEREPIHEYCLPNHGKVDYKQLHNHGEYQLDQLQTEWFQKMFKDVDNNKQKKVNFQSSNMFSKVVGVVMTQMTKQDKYGQVLVKEGICHHGQWAVDAILAEYAQLNERNIFKPKRSSELSANSKRESLNLIMLEKEKSCGEIKGRACANGHKQRRCL